MKSVMTITLIVSQVYLLLESLNRLTLRQIGGAFFGALLFAVLPWTHTIVESGINLSSEVCALFFLLMVLTYQFSRSLDFLLAGIVMILMLFALSSSLVYKVIALPSFLLVTMALKDRERMANHSGRFLGLYGVLVGISLGSSWYTNAMSAESLWYSLGGIVLLVVSLLGYLKIHGFWQQHLLCFIAILGAVMSMVGTFFFSLFIILAVLFLLGVLPRFWMKYPFVAGFIYCCWETWAT